jgi:hypothetical protein
MFLGDVSPAMRRAIETCLQLLPVPPPTEGRAVPERHATAPPVSAGPLLAAALPTPER